MPLTDEQHAIITLGYEHCLITAVAGSGKTTTLAWRIRHLLEQGHDPERMLILMFNRAARADFTRKLREITQGTGLVLPEVRTYHAMGFRLYRRFIREGYLPAYQGEILSDAEIHYQVWQLTRALAPESLQGEMRRGKKEFTETAANFIDWVKSSLSPAEVVFEELGYDEKYHYLIDLFHGFEQWRKNGRRISYADMLYEPVLAIHQNPPLQKLVGNKMDLVMVDEYQDTNEIQHLLLRYIAGDRARVTVVGDPDQTIYEFRGARPEFILRRFASEFDDPTELTLSYTFRYGHRLALLADHLITHNLGRKDVLCHAHSGTPATRVYHETPDDEAEFIVRLAQAVQRGQPLPPAPGEAGLPTAGTGINRSGETEPYARSLNDVAVLVRVWSQSVPIELRLLARQIPYRIDANRGALFTREIEALSYLLGIASGELATAPVQDRRECFRAILRFPHVGLREAELNELANYLGGFAGGWGQVLIQADTSDWKPLPARKIRKLGEALTELEGSGLSATHLITRYATTTELFEGIRSLALTHETADERIGTVTGFQHYLASLDVNAGQALDHLQVLKNQASSQNQQDGIHLSTIHRAKGLEWSLVIVPGLQEKYLPYTGRQSERGESLQAHIESERRLLYVAMTRAIRALYLLTPAATGNDPEQAPSRFLAEMCLPLSDELGAALSQPHPPEKLTLVTPVTAIAQRYARREDISLEGPAPVQRQASGSAPGDAGTSGTPLWSCRQLRHGIFGTGTVVSEDERAFEVLFEDGKRLNFSKKSAHLYFTPVGTDKRP